MDRDIMEPPDTMGRVEEHLEQWLTERIPEIPGAFRPHLLPPEPVTVAGPGTLADLGAAALADALATPGRQRGAAFRLLAGDALLTYACEAAAQEEDPGSWLESLLASLGDRFR